MAIAMLDTSSLLKNNKKYIFLTIISLLISPSVCVAVNKCRNTAIKVLK